MHRAIQNIQGVRTTLLWIAKRITDEDKEKNFRVLGCSGNLDEWISCAKAVHLADPFDKIVSFDDEDIVKASIISEVLNVDFFPPNLVKTISDKYLMRQVLRSKGIDDTASVLVNTVEDIEHFAEKYRYPIIIKPISKYGSIGVSKVSSVEEIGPAFTRGLQESNNSQMIVEQYIYGQEYTVECFSENGTHQVVATTMKFNDPITKVEYAHICNAPLSEKQKSELSIFISQVLTAMGMIPGPSHTEFIISPDNKFRIVESHIRLAGDFCPEMIMSTVGVDMIGTAALSVLGYPILESTQKIINLHREKNLWCSVNFRHDNVFGIFQGVENIEEVENMKGIEQVRILKGKGDFIRPTECSKDRLTMVRAVSNNMNEAIELARKGSNALKINVKLTNGEK
jgi:biotin carboxylase